MSRLTTRVLRAVPVRLRGQRDPGLASHPPTIDTPCFAPFSNLYLNTDGDVRACCVNDAYPLGNITTQRLPEIWGGARQAVLRAKIRAHDYSAGCGHCAWRADGGMRTYAEVYDHLRDQGGPLDDEGVPTFPRRIEFNLSNSCNLACHMCHGGLSSTIRLHREKLPPLPKVWDDQFFDDLREFIPHLNEASFAGGEPFMGAENYRAWDLIAELAPEMPVKITTNGTQWNARVERVLDELEVWPHISLDAHTKETFEAIRERADHDLIMTNLDRFRAYANQRGTETRIMHCLMPQNYHELADLLLFAEDRDMPVTVTVVTYPPDFALERLDRSQLHDVLALFSRQYEQFGDRLVRNGPALLDQIHRLENWLATDRQPLEGDKPEPPILGFARMGDPIDEDVARRILEPYGPEAYDNVIAVDADGVVTRCSPSAAAALDLTVDELVGLQADELLPTLIERLGPPRSDDTTVADDLVDRRLTWDQVEYRSIVQPARDELGWADEAVIRVAVRTTG